ncbi:MAG: 3'-5' exonuclease [Thermoguttaceae bacterium]|nr:3'-5' exonuclease [Thermoguttaceae bacterium]
MEPQDSSNSIRFLIFDIESVSDPALVSLVRTGGEKSPQEALSEYQKELVEKKGTDFVPYVYQQPISLALAKVRGDLSLQELIVLKVEDGGPQKICERFWSGWLYYERPQFVTFNGRKFDIPLMELTAFRYGIPLPEWFNDSGPNYTQPRYRFCKTYHLDLNDELTNGGATAFEGGLNLASKMLHKAGKIDVRGNMVQEMFESGQLAEIHRYCRCDVLDTYFVFLRYSVLKGRISFEREKELVAETRDFLESRSEEEPVYREYLDAWAQVDEFQNQHNIFSKYVDA